MCLKSIEMYTDIKDKLLYYKNQDIVEKFALLVAREIMEDKEKEQTTSFVEFEKMYFEIKSL